MAFCNPCKAEAILRLPLLSLDMRSDRSSMSMRQTFEADCHHKSNPMLTVKGWNTELKVPTLLARIRLPFCMIMAPNQQDNNMWEDGQDHGC